jgi:PEP-CTERM motif-containing protein
MTTGVLIRSLRMLAIGALFATSSVTSLSEEPIIVTSGQFQVGFDNPTFFRFFGTDGFTLSGIFIQTLSSPQQTCVPGCAPGAAVNMSAVAGGESAVTPFPLGFSTGAVINGTEFLRPFGLQAESPLLAGTLRFDAPVVVLPNFTAPFVFNGQVTGFAHDDLDARMPLFDVALVGQGTARLTFEDFFEGTFREPVATYTFAATPAVPEPTTILLLGTGLAVVGLRRWRERRCS